MISKIAVLAAYKQVCQFCLYLLGDRRCAAPEMLYKFQASILMHRFKSGLGVFINQWQ